MAQLKKTMKKTGGGGSGEGKPPPLNAPFAAARKELLALVAPAAKPVVSPRPQAKPVAQISEEDRLSDDELFTREMSGVQRGDKAPRSSRGRELPIEQQREAQIRQSEDAEAYAQLSDLLDGTGTFDISDTDEYIEGIADGLDRRLLSRLRRGDFAIQGHVDLHGLTRDEARIRVEGFLHESRLRSRRCVLIVHGRGLNSKDQIPVLKESVRIWLTRGRIGRQVLAFATARPTDGGAGAVYVLLRR